MKKAKVQRSLFFSKQLEKLHMNHLENIYSPSTLILALVKARQKGCEFDISTFKEIIDNEFPFLKGKWKSTVARTYFIRHNTLKEIDLYLNNSECGLKADLDKLHRSLELFQKAKNENDILLQLNAEKQKKKPDYCSVIALSLELEVEREQFDKKYVECVLFSLIREMNFKYQCLRPYLNNLQKDGAILKDKLSEKEYLLLEQGAFFESGNLNFTKEKLLSLYPFDVDKTIAILTKLQSFNSTAFKSELIKEFKALPKIGQNILSLRFGLFGKDKTTLQAIGEEYNLTRERIRQIENETLNEIKRSKIALLYHLFCANFAALFKKKSASFKEVEYIFGADCAEILSLISLPLILGDTCLYSTKNRFFYLLK